MKYYDLEDGNYPENSENNPDEFFGNGWSVKRENEIYTFSYISGSLQGKLKSIEISEDDFNLAKEGKINFDQLCIKYNVS